MKELSIGFIGFGLIGGSIAQALKLSFPTTTIMAYNHYQNKSHPGLEVAKQDGTIDIISTKLEDYASCDIIFLCAPVLDNIHYLKKMKSIIIFPLDFLYWCANVSQTIVLACGTSDGYKYVQRGIVQR